GLYIASWTAPDDLAGQADDASGVVLSVEVLPSKKLRGVYVDARQAQLKARGNADAPASLSNEDYRRAVRQQISWIFEGAEFGTLSCDDVAKSNPLRTGDFYAVESLNGYTTLSQLLRSVATP